MATYTFYRAVKSGPAKYKERGGFKPFVQIDLPQIRNMLKNAFKGEANAVTIPEAAEVLRLAYQTKSNWSALDLAREIKREKSTTTCHLSTDLSEDCGGYATGNYVFMIQYNDLYINDILNNQSRTDLSPVVKPKLVSNAANISDATVLGIASGGNEISFLTPIPLDKIVKYRAPNTTAWANCNWD